MNNFGIKGLLTSSLKNVANCRIHILYFTPSLEPRLIYGKTGSFSERQVVMEPSQLLRIPLKVLSRTAILQAKKTMALETSIENL